MRDYILVIITKFKYFWPNEFLLLAARADPYNRTPKKKKIHAS